MGGAIYNSETGNITTLNKLTIGNAKNNKSQNIANYGGAIFNAGVITEISSSTLSRNYAAKAGDTDGNGGAIYNTGTIDKIVDTTMSNVVADGNGGAIYNAGTINSINRKSTMSNNSAGGSGGAIYNDGTEISAATLTLSGATMANNIASVSGGAIYNGIYGSITFTTAMEGNKSFYTTFNKNTAGTYGGAIYNEGVLTCWSSTFTSNKTNSTVLGGGGAIYNNGTLDIKNASTFTMNTSYDGGAIYNDAAGSLTLDKVTFGDLKKAKSANTAYHDGGAIYNLGSIDIQNSVLSRNTATNNGGLIYAGVKDSSASITILAHETVSYNTAGNLGGAIYSSGQVFLNSTIDGESLATSRDLIFDNNYAKSGGAVYIDASTDVTNGKLIALNTVFSNNKAQNGNGGAIALMNMTSTEENIIKSSQFTNNTAVLTADDATASGGAVYNTSRLTILNSTFENNFAVNGGHIFNATTGVLTLGKNVKFSFVPQSKAKYTYSANGGAIYNSGNLTYTTDETTSSGNLYFSGNYVTGDGGAIYNGSNATLGTPTEDSGFRVVYESNTAKNNGGAIYNAGTTTIAYSDLNSNTATNGGAIYNVGDLTIDKSATFSGNSATKSGGILFNANTLTIVGTSSSYIQLNNSSAQRGGAISNGFAEGGSSATNTYLNISYASFEGNVVVNKEKDTGSFGGAIYNGGKNTSIVSTIIANSIFKNNKSNGNNTDNSTGGGGALFNDDAATIVGEDDTAGLTNTQFIENSTLINGGAIYNVGKLYGEDNTFTGNTAKKFGGAIFNYKGDYNNELKMSASTFENNTAASGGAVYNYGGTYTSENNIYYGNKASLNAETEGYGGAIYNGSVFVSTGDKFKSNEATDGGAVYIKAYSNTSTIIKNAEFTLNNASKNGGAIYLAYGVNAFVDNSTFENNTTQVASGGAIFVGEKAHLTMRDTSMTKNNAYNGYGGAIFVSSYSTVDIIAETADVYIENNISRDDADITLDAYSTLNLDAYENRKLKIGKIRKFNGATGAKINLYGDGDIEIGNQTDLANITTEISGHITIANEYSLNGASLISNGARLNIANGRVSTIVLKSLNLKDDTQSNVAIDMDLKSGTADNITADETTGTGTLNVSTIKLTSNSKKAVEVPIADENSSITTLTATKAESDEATYKIKSYKNMDGVLTALAYGQKAKPAVMAAPIAAQIGGFLTEVNSFDQAFANLDMEMLKTSEERKAEEMMNKYAVTQNAVSTYSEKEAINHNSKGLWNRAYATFEHIPFRGGIGVNNVGYGNFFGGDMGKKELSNGWSRQFSAYIGYNGSTQDYTRQSIDQNGGQIGIMETWYKGNFFTALTANVGGNNAEGYTDLGREHMAMLLAGVASKTGYNFEFRGKCYNQTGICLIVQPSLLISYSFVNMFSHNNGRGHKVSSSPIHAIQVAPGIKFIANLKNGWQPYIGVNMRWNIMDRARFEIQDVSIPTLSVKPYVEYGIGLQKRWGDRFTGYGQAMIRNGGRDGVSLSFGFKWSLGK